MNILPERVRTLREAKGWSKQELANRTQRQRDDEGHLLGVTLKTIQRIESGEGRKAQPRKVVGLAKALSVDPNVLTGEAPMPDQTARQDAGPSVQVNALIRPRYRLAYALASRRYGVPASALIEMAPLMFTLLAEQSLRRRRERVERMEEIARELSDHHDAAGRLPYGVGAIDVKNITEAERRSIGAADVFGKIVPDVVAIDDRDPDATNPFADYLRGLSEEIARPDVVEVKEGTLYASAPDGFPGYELCSADLDKIVDDSDRARYALTEGHASLGKMPKELLADDATQDRIVWLEQQVSDDDWNRWASLTESLNLDDLLSEGEVA